MAVPPYRAPMAPGIQKLEDGPRQDLPACLFDPRPHTRTVIDDEAEMAAAVLVRCRSFHEVDELVSELDKSVARPFAAEREVKNLAGEGESLANVATFERELVSSATPALP